MLTVEKDRWRLRFELLANQSKQVMEWKLLDPKRGLTALSAARFCIGSDRLTGSFSPAS
jgi:hypothetical protein